MSHPRTGKSLFDDHLIITAHWKAFSDEVTCNLIFGIVYLVFCCCFLDLRMRYISQCLPGYCHQIFEVYCTVYGIFILSFVQALELTRYKHTNKKVYSILSVKSMICFFFFLFLWYNLFQIESTPKYPQKTH